jgi:hypothetical protein
MSASDKEFQRGIAMMKAAMPDGATLPRNEDEWSKAVAALEQLGYAMYLESGMSEAEARTLAHITHGGATGRLLLAIAKRREAI